ncbi:hypothetical protein D1164_06510 [Mariniphaga sediminis]|uniref:Uncharacterized protein n=1 Tax=Mariniphaga sediminis TaxID=1628158 RepID=A0A399D1Z5_9BACT|nr:hypothetical protein D1164_06510 [Mariniphaga sediminis]
MRHSLIFQSDIQDSSLQSHSPVFIPSEQGQMKNIYNSLKISAKIIHLSNPGSFYPFVFIY